MKELLHELQDKIQYHFQDEKLLKQAITHSSYSNEHRRNKFRDNERLEFLGDAVLEIVTSEYLYYEYPKCPEGDLTKKRASIVCEQTLALCAREIQLGDYLLLGKGEEQTGGRYRASITSDAMEALIGAIYLDGGFANAKEFIQKFILLDIKNKQLFFDSKTILQEMIQAESDELLSYQLIHEEGPDHNKNFLVQAVLGTKILGEGNGKTKKAAEQSAAYHAILNMKHESR